AEHARLEIERPAVVATAPRARELLAADRERDAAVGALVVESVHLPLLAQEHDGLAQQGEGLGLAADRARPGHRIPVVAEAERCRLVAWPHPQVPLPRRRLLHHPAPPSLGCSGASPWMVRSVPLPRPALAGA